MLLLLRNSRNGGRLQNPVVNFVGVIFHND